MKRKDINKVFNNLSKSYKEKKKLKMNINMKRKNIQKIINNLNELYKKKIKESPQIKILEGINDPKFDKCIISYNVNGEREKIEENIYKEDLNIFEEGIEFLYKNGFKDSDNEIYMLNEEFEEYLLRYDNIRKIFNSFNDK